MKKNILFSLVLILQINAYASPECIVRPAMKLSTGKKVLVSRYQEIMHFLETLAASYPEVLNDLYKAVTTTRKKTRCYVPENKFAELESLIEQLTGDANFLWDKTGTLHADVRYIITACCKQLEDGTIELIAQ